MRKMSIEEVWQKRHLQDREGINFSVKWHKVISSIVVATDIGYDTMDFVAGKKPLEELDLFRAFWEYGYSLEISGNWTSSPYDDLSKAEKYIMSSEGGMPTLYHLRDLQAQFAGGMLHVLGQAQDELTGLLYRQVEAKKAAYLELLKRPVEFYTPQEFTQDEQDDGDDAVEMHRFNEVFHLRERLECFEIGLERLRMLVSSERAPELNLPNMELFSYLARIESPLLMQTYEHGDEHLKRILRHLAEFGYTGVSEQYAPEEFWWRHWKPKQRRNERSNNRRKNKKG
jgi:hypothetical protein